MHSKTTRAFWKCFDRLPNNIQASAERSYLLWRENPKHPSINFKRVSRKQAIYSARVSIDYRALGLLAGDTVTWFWIGSHADYDKLLS